MIEPSAHETDGPMDIFESLQHIVEKLQTLDQSRLVWIVVGQMLLLVAVIVLKVFSHFRFRRLQLEKADAVRAGEQRLATQKHELRTEFADEKAELKFEIKSLNEKITALTHDASLQEGKHQQHSDDLERELESMQSDNAALTSELGELQRRFDQLGKLDRSIWIADTPVEPPQFVPAFERRARIVSFLNLKGGVGKTTLTTNIAAGLATSITGRTYRTLAVDLDFQGSLSNSCLNPSILNDRRRQSATVSQLLASADEPSTLLSRMAAPMQQTNDQASVVIASEGLDEVDFHHQAQFAVQHVECRFDHRRVFHDHSVASEFDFVFFDCPPRLTTSSINALLCSDFLIIPTSLAPHDIDALRRTLAVFRELEHFDEFRARVLGIIANRTYRGGPLDTGATSYETNQIERLRGEVQRAGFPKSVIFETMVPGKSKIAQAGVSGVALGADKKDGHSIYRGVVSEFLRRVQDTEPIREQQVTNS